MESRSSSLDLGGPAAASLSQMRGDMLADRRCTDDRTAIDVRTLSLR